MIRAMLVGRAGVGKDTVAALMKKHAGEPVSLASLAEGVKLQVAAMLDMAIDKYGVPRAKLWQGSDESVLRNANELRRLLRPIWQWYGTDFVRSADPGFWIRDLHKRTGHVQNLIVTDCRFKNEADYARRNGLVLLRVAGPDRRNTPESDPVLRHESERQVDDIACQFVIDNGCTLTELEDYVASAVLPFVRLHSFHGKEIANGF